ncbi:MAG TPA: hypothetical protein VMU15_02465 [Anaeromyxobacter sp.]|nr:hypothetical protein [Anaeromyxobacter sp.]
MKHHAPDEALAKLVTEPDEVVGVACSGRRAHLDPDADDLRCRDLGEEVDLVTPLLLAQVIEAQAALGYGRLGAQLGCDEGVQKAPEEVPFAEDRVRIHPQDAGEKRLVRAVALGRADEPLQAIGRPRLCAVDDHEGEENLLVGHRVLSIEPRSLEQRLLPHQAGGVESVVLEVAPELGWSRGPARCIASRVSSWSR